MTIRSVTTVDANEGGLLWDGIPPSGDIRSAVVRVRSSDNLTASIIVRQPGFNRKFHLNAPLNPGRFAVGENDRLLLEVEGLANAGKSTGNPVFVDLYWSSIPVESDRDVLYLFQDTNELVGSWSPVPEGAVKVFSSEDDPDWEFDNPFQTKPGVKKGSTTEVGGARFRPAVANNEVKWILSPI